MKTQPGREIRNLVEIYIFPGFSDLVFFELDHDLKTGGWATAYLDPISGLENKTRSTEDRI